MRTSQETTFQFDFEMKDKSKIHSFKVKGKDVIDARTSLKNQMLEVVDQISEEERKEADLEKSAGKEHNKKA